MRRMPFETVTNAIRPLRWQRQGHKGQQNDDAARQDSRLLVQFGWHIALGGRDAYLNEMGVPKRYFFSTVL